MSRILFVHAGDDHARESFAAGSAYWSQALPLVLEKHGLLGVSVQDVPTWNSAEYDAVLVARLPARLWTPELAELLRDSPVPSLVEGPLPPAVLDVLGVDELGERRREGTVRVADRELKEAASAYGMPLHAELAETRESEISRPAELEWRALGVPLTDQQAEAWRAEAWDIQGWRARDPDGPHVLATLSAESDLEDAPAVVRRRSLIGCCFGLFGLLGRRHTSEPFDPGEWRTSPRSAGLEAMLLGLIDQMHRTRGATRVRVLPWPHPYRWVQTVRHDFDRPLPVAEADALLAAHREIGSRATWYWRPCHADSEALGVVAGDPAHEIALHTEVIWTEDDGRAAVEEAVGRPVAGTAAHGGSDCFRYQGAPNVLWADRHGFRYTELPQQWHLHPHRFASLEADGTLATLEVLCLPHHLSFDRSARPGDTLAAEIDRALPLWRAAGGCAQIMNHPDINREEFSGWLARTPDEGGLFWTAREVAEWWRRTHVAGAVDVVAVPGGFELSSREPVSGLVVELLEPDGTRVEHVVDLEPGQPRRVETTALEPTWADVSDAFADAVRNYHAARGDDPNSQAVATTIRTNGELIPQRGDFLLRLLSEMAGVEATGRRVLDLGCGFGALATYLAWRARPDELVAIDTRPDYLAVAEECARSIGLSEVLRFEQADMRDLERLGTEAFDLVVANNSFIYLATQRDVTTALAEIHSALRPGGHVLFYQANRWRWDEPFTKDPLVHLLPPALGKFVARLTGWRHNHGRVRLLSPLELRRRLSRAGFVDFRMQTFGKHRDSRPPLNHFGGFFAAAAAKPGSER